MELTLAEIKQRVDSAKEQYPYPDFHGEPLIALMELYNQQQAEIERLKAEMTAIQSLIAYRGTDFIAKVYEIAERNGDIQQQPEPPQESLTPAELGEMAGRAEAVEEPPMWYVYAMNGGEFLEVAKSGSHKEILINQDKKWERIAWCGTWKEANEYREMVINSRKA